MTTAEVATDAGDKPPNEEISLDIARSRDDVLAVGQLLYKELLAAHQINPNTGQVYYGTGRCLAPESTILIAREKTSQEIVGCLSFIRALNKEMTWLLPAAVTCDTFGDTSWEICEATPSERIAQVALPAMKSHVQTEQRNEINEILRAGAIEIATQENIASLIATMRPSLAQYYAEYFQARTISDEVEVPLSIGGPPLPTVLVEIRLIDIAEETRSKLHADYRQHSIFDVADVKNDLTEGDQSELLRMQSGEV